MRSRNLRILFALVLAFCMVLALAAPALADDTTAPPPPPGGEFDPNNPGPPPEGGPGGPPPEGGMPGEPPEGGEPGEQPPAPPEGGENGEQPPAPPEGGENGEQPPAPPEGGETGEQPPEGGEPVYSDTMQAENTHMNDERRELFEAGTMGIMGVDYEPLGYLACREITFPDGEKGIEHFFACEKVLIASDQPSTVGTMIIFEGSDGAVRAKLDSFEEMELQNLIAALGFDPFEASMPGDVMQAEDQSLTLQRMGIFSAAAAEYEGMYFEPVAYLASQVVAGMNHWFLCVGTAVVPGAEPALYSVQVWQQPDGNCVITNVEKITSDQAVAMIGFDPLNAGSLIVMINPLTMSAKVYGSYDGPYYARLAAAVQIKDQTGLIVTQVQIRPDGTITAPLEMLNPDMKVLGVSIALVDSVADITSPTPHVLAGDSFYLPSF